MEINTNGEKTISEEKYWEWFCSVPGLYQTHREALLRFFGSPEEVWRAPERTLERVGKQDAAWSEQLLSFRKRHTPEETVHIRKSKKIEFISCEHPQYPENLRQLRDYPHGIFFRGKLPDPQKTKIAIVGARACTHYGKRMAEELAGKVTQAGGQVISGAACGIDGAAQWQALEEGGESFAVLGCGVDVRYPASHERLFERLEEEGGIVSEYPPGTAPLRFHFPLRNRLISGLADAVAVVEARRGSGSLITADCALEQGRAVLAVPGRPDDELSRGCNELIAQGAGVILSAESFAEQLFPDFRRKKKNQTSDILLAPSEKLVYSSLGLHSKSFWELAECTSLSLAELSACLFSLEEKGLAREAEQNYYIRTGQIL